MMHKDQTHINRNCFSIGIISSNLQSGCYNGLGLNHIARRYNETADELAKIASGRTTVPPDVFSRDLHQPSIKINDAPELEEASAIEDKKKPGFFDRGFRSCLSHMFDPGRCV